MKIVVTVPALVSAVVSQLATEKYKASRTAYCVCGTQLLRIRVADGVNLPERVLLNLSIDFYVSEVFKTWQGKSTKSSGGTFSQITGFKAL
jgi:hypothetical protein